MARDKKIKRQMKKKTAIKAKATAQHNKNKQIKASRKNWSMFDRDPATYTVPIDYWVGFPNDKICEEEVAFLSEVYSHRDIPAYIYPLDDNLAKAMNYRLKIEEQEPISFPSIGWVVVSTKTMLPMVAFEDITQAKKFVLDYFTQVKLIRSNSLGLLSGYPDFSDLPDMDSSVSKETWIDYCLQLENNHGFQFDPLDLVEYLICQLIEKHDAPQALHDNFYNEGLLEPTLRFVAERGFTSYQLAFDMLSVFESDISRINMNNR